MLFRPSADQNLDAVHAMLEAWNGEADRFREAAVLARSGEAPNPLTVSAAEEAHDGLISLLEELDDALGKIKPGTPQFSALLKAQITATGLLESVGNSYDLLDRFASRPLDGPTRISHELRVAAE